MDMDGGMDGSMDGGMKDGWMGGKTDGWMEEWRDEQGTDGFVNGCREMNYNILHTCKGAAEKFDNQK